MRHSHAIALFSALMFQGCSTTNKTDPNHSLAWNISKAAGVNVREIPQEEFDKAAGKEFNGQKSSKMFDMAALSSTASYAQYYDIGFLTRADIWENIGYSTLFVMLEPDDPAGKDHFLAWMPASLSPDEKSAVRELARTFVHALKGLPEPYPSMVDWKKTEDAIKSIETNFFKPDFNLDVYLAGGECDVFDCALRIKIFEPVLKTPPDFIKSNETSAYAFGPEDFAIPQVHLACMLPNQFSKSGKPIIEEKTPEFMSCSKRFSLLWDEYAKGLPSWIYTYWNHVPKSETAVRIPNLSTKEGRLLYIQPSKK